MKNLDELRSKIDDLDTELLKIISKRTEIAAEIGIVKNAQGIELLDKKRKDFVLKKWIKEANNKNLSVEMIKKLYRLIHKISIDIERNVR